MHAACVTRRAMTKLSSKLVVKGRSVALSVVPRAHSNVQPSRKHHKQLHDQSRQLCGEVAS